jgi:4-amino-4-deoxy-L-arabinose transferase-like glycosyltransferase
MTAGLLAAGVGETAALRLPSMLFALGMLAATAWLARLLAPERPWAMPLSVALLASSVQFWIYANSAMLDAGAGFFAAVAVAAAVVALERPRVWYLVAVLAGIGALQKAPVGLFFVPTGLFGLWLARRWVPSPRLRGKAAVRRAGCWRWGWRWPGRCCSRRATDWARSASRMTGRCSGVSSPTRTRVCEASAICWTS